MTFALLEDEWHLMERVPMPDLIELAVDLDVLVPANPERRELIEMVVPLLVERGRAEGLPFSRYDLDDLAALSPEGIAALANLQGLRPGATAKDVMHAGEKVYRRREKSRSGIDPVGYMLPLLLGPVVRHAVERGLHHAGSA